MSWLWIALLACALVVLVGAEWPRLAERFGQATRGRRRTRDRSHLTVLRELPPDSEDFAASVERDLSQLPTIEERDRRKR